MSLSARWTMRRIIPGVVLILAGVPLAAGAASGNGDAGRPVAAAAADDAMVSETRQLLDVFIQRWNDNQLSEAVEGLYAEDALAIPPNHEPIRGRAAILEFLKSLRDLIGPFDQAGGTLIQARAKGDMVSFAGQYTFRGGTIRIVTHEAYERQPDGSIRNIVDMFGYRDPGK